MTEDEKRAIVERIEPRLWDTGPNRVIVSKSGEAVPHRDALQQGVIVQTYFIRDDGWTLGASEELEPEAEELWKDRWIARFDRGKGLTIL